VAFPSWGRLGGRFCCYLLRFEQLNWKVCQNAGAPLQWRPPRGGDSRAKFVAICDDSGDQLNWTEWFVKPKMQTSMHHGVQDPYENEDFWFHGLPDPDQNADSWIDGIQDRVKMLINKYYYGCRASFEYKQPSTSVLGLGEPRASCCQPCPEANLYAKANAAAESRPCGRSCVDFVSRRRLL